ncbi:uncharacterized protein PAF06_004348 [Gastrophryne carolinensis]
MDPGHHTAFLLAILICILLLLLAVSSLIMCYLRKNGFKIKNIKSQRFGRLVKDQATSMTSFAFNAMDSRFSLYSEPKKVQALSLPISMESGNQKGKTPNSHLYLDRLAINMGDDDDEEGLQTSELTSKTIQRISESSGGYTALKRVCSSGASMFATVLEKSSLLKFKAKRRSSSLKSGVGADILMISLESPVGVPPKSAGETQSTSSPRDLSCSSTVLCENSCDQQFTWDTVGLSLLSQQVEHKESCSVPTTLERRPCTLEGESTNQNAQLQSSQLLQPKSWFIFMGNRPVSDGVQLESKELNNVTSLDSGVDITEAPRGNRCRGPEMPQRTFPINEKHLLAESPKETNKEAEALEMDPEQEFHISHQEAARKLNPGYYNRSLWEKREERPLIGVN